MATEKDLGDIIPRKVMTTFLLVDSSGSMHQNGNIGKVNSAIEEMIPMLQDVSDDNADAEIKIAVMSFSSGCEWITKDSNGEAGPETLDQFFWNDLSAGGLTDMGAAFTELEKKLSRDAFLKSDTGAYAPVIVLLSDGAPTDDWKKGLEKLKHNNWYKCATKVAICVDDGDPAVLSEFTGSSETVLMVNSGREDLKKLLCRLVVVASSIVSRSVNSGFKGSDEDAGKQHAKDAMKEIKKDDKEGENPPVPNPPGDNPWDTGVW